MRDVNLKCIYNIKMIKNIFMVGNKYNLISKIIIKRIKTISNKY